MFSGSSLAKPYAQALFNLAREKNALAAWSADLALIKTFFADDDLQAALVNPRLKKTGLWQLLEAVFANKITAESLQLLKILVEKEDLELLPSIIDQYEKMRAKYDRVMTVKVKSVHDLTELQKTRLQKALEKVFSLQVKLEYLTSKELLGGLLLEIGDHVIDGSIDGAVKRLAFALTR